VVQGTLFSTLTAGIRRVVSVVAGVLVAALLSSVVGLTWWSLGAVIGAALLIGHALRLGEHLLEVPISAMLVLGVGSLAGTAATFRVAETLVGAGVGVLVNVLLPPTLRTGSAGAWVERVAIEAAALINRVAEELPAGVSRQQAMDWLEDFRGMSRNVESADRAVNEAAISRRLNPRAVGTPNTQPLLRSGLDALEHSTVALRALFRSLADGVPEPDGSSPGHHDSHGYDEELREAFAVLLGDLAACVRAFGAMVRAEAEATGPIPETALATTLDAVREARAMLTELLLVDAREEPDLWLLRGSLLAAVERVLRELDVEERAHQRERWQRDEADRSRIALAMARLRDTSRQIADRPRRRLRRP
jgi:Aromatic acid exporter family member 1